jgi:hypothetical protein
MFLLTDNAHIKDIQETTKSFKVIYLVRSIESVTFGIGDLYQKFTLTKACLIHCVVQISST